MNNGDDKPKATVEEELADRVFVEERIKTIDSMRADSDKFDRWILTLAAGTFMLTVTFITNLFSAYKPVLLCLLILGWLSLLCVIGLVLFGLIYALKAHLAKSQLQLAIQTDSWEEQKIYQQELAKRSGNQFKFNYIALALLLLGFILVGLFVAGNLIHQNSTKYKTETTEETVTQNKNDDLKRKGIINVEPIIPDPPPVDVVEQNQQNHDIGDSSKTED